LEIGSKGRITKPVKLVFAERYFKFEVLGRGSWVLGPERLF